MFRWILTVTALASTAMIPATALQKLYYQRLPGVSIRLGWSKTKPATATAGGVGWASRFPVATFSGPAASKVNDGNDSLAMPSSAATIVGWSYRSAALGIFLRYGLASWTVSRCVAILGFAVSLRLLLHHGPLSAHELGSTASKLSEIRRTQNLLKSRMASGGGGGVRRRVLDYEEAEALVCEARARRHAAAEVGGSAIVIALCSQYNRPLLLSLAIMLLHSPLPRRRVVTIGNPCADAIRTLNIAAIGSALLAVGAAGTVAAAEIAPRIDAGSAAFSIVLISIANRLEHGACVAAAMFSLVSTAADSRTTLTSDTGNLVLMASSSSSQNDVDEQSDKSSKSQPPPPSPDEDPPPPGFWTKGRVVLFRALVIMALMALKLKSGDK